MLVAPLDHSTLRGSGQRSLPLPPAAFDASTALRPRTIIAHSGARFTTLGLTHRIDLPVSPQGVRSDSGSEAPASRDEPRAQRSDTGTDRAVASPPARPPVGSPRHRWMDRTSTASPPQPSSTRCSTPPAADARSSSAPRWSSNASAPWPRLSREHQANRDPDCDGRPDRHSTAPQRRDRANRGVMPARTTASRPTPTRQDAQRHQTETDGEGERDRNRARWPPLASTATTEKNRLTFGLPGRILRFGVSLS